MKELAALLEQARSASPERRIEVRDPIAAHGSAGIEAVTPWLRDEALAAFAVRVIEKAGLNGESALATSVLRAARTKVPPAVADDVAWSLQCLKAAAQPRVPAAPAPSPRAPARQAARPVAIRRRRAS